MGNTISILIASGYQEDQKEIFAILSGQDDFLVVGVVKDEVDALIQSANLKPDALILDLQPSEIDGPELAPMIHRNSPATAIILMCDKDDDNYACRALMAGISGFLIKKADTDKLVPIIKIVCSDGYFISASIAIKIFSAIAFMEHFPGQSAQYSKLWYKYMVNYPSFSPTERSIVTYLARGYSDKKIAECLHFNIGTIRNSLSSIRRKIKLKSRIQIIIFSLVYGLVKFEHINIKDNFDRQIFNDTIQ